jgi:hypothetical protein
VSTNIRSQIVQYKKYLIHISLIPPPEGWRSRSIISELSDRLGLACLDDSDRFATEDEAVLHSVRLGMRWIDKQENKSTTSTSKELYATAPGTFIALESSVGWHLRSSIEIMANYFSDAHLAQILFEEAAARQRSAHAEFGQVYRRARREAFMYAREFVFACDYFVKEFKKMTEQKDAPSGIAEELENSKTRIPEIVNLRNSLHHPEDRRRGEKRGGKKITIQPINKYPFKSEVGFMIISSIIGSRIMGTAADGRLVEVDVSVATLHEMAQTLQHVIDALPWYTFHGPHRYPDADF